MHIQTYLRLVSCVAALSGTEVNLLVIHCNISTMAQTYVGLTANQFKDRWYQHDGDFKHPERRIATELSSHIWDLKDKAAPYNIQWEIVKRANPFSLIKKDVSFV